MLAGLKYEGRSRSTGSFMQVFIADEQGVDVDNQKYAVVCDTHGTLCGSSSLRDARILCAYPMNFCEECMDESEKRESNGTTQTEGS